ncbi:MAG: hypothetical protein RMK99_08065 [Anaerolineales bacterium]|nr:hypothetical protein [Anaerolineales bacterium]
MTPTPDDYLELRSRFAVTRELAQRALTWAQPLALEALGIHARRQTLIEGELPVYLVMTRPETNGGWGEFMPVWFKPYERPVPLYCLDNWALFALFYRSAFGSEVDEADAAAFTVENLVRVVIGADLLIPFLPGTDGAGRFLRHGALPVLLASLWLEPETRAAWLRLHDHGARRFAAENGLAQREDVGEWLERVENEAWLVPERTPVAGEAAVRAFLARTEDVQLYQALFGGLCLGVSALFAALGDNWRRWVFQAVNVGYRMADFGLNEIRGWLIADSR